MRALGSVASRYLSFCVGSECWQSRDGCMSLISLGSVLGFLLGRIPGGYYSSSSDVGVTSPRVFFSLFVLPIYLSSSLTPSTVLMMSLRSPAWRPSLRFMSSLSVVYAGQSKRKWVIVSLSTADISHCQFRSPYRTNLRSAHLSIPPNKIYGTSNM